MTTGDDGDGDDHDEAPRMARTKKRSRPIARAHAKSGDIAAAPAPAPQPTTPTARLPFPAEALVLALIVVAPYIGSLSNGFVYDDLVLIQNKPAPASLSDALSVFTSMHHPSGLPYYRPLSGLTLAVQKAIWGDAPWAYHLFNLLLLLALAFAARALFAAVSRRAESRLVPFAFAALFAVHPAASSVVHAIAGRETLLVSLFMATALWAYLRAGARWYAAAVALFAGALLCKEHGVAAPLLFVAADLTGASAGSPRHLQFHRRGLRALAWLKRYALIAAVVAAYFVIRRQILPAPSADATPAHFALFDDPTGPLASLLYTLQTIFLPTIDLSYEPHIQAWWSFGRLILLSSIVIGLAIAVRRLAWERRGAIGLWIGWFFATLLPSANLITQETKFDERYVVLPLLGLVGVAATLASEAWSRPSLRPWLGSAAAALALALGLISDHRGTFFRDDLAFLQQWAKSDPTSHQAQASLGEHYRARRRFEEAIPHEKAALGLVHAELGEPLCIKRHFALAEAYEFSGHLEQAAGELREILRMRPSYKGARSYLDRVQGKMAASGGVARTGVDWGDEARAALKSRLSADGSRRIWLATTKTNPSALERTKELEGVFREAGWDIGGVEQVSFPMKAGLFLFVADEEAPAYVTSLRDHLGAAGLPVGTMATGYRDYARDKRRQSPGWSGFELAPDQPYVLAVGPRSE